MIFTFADHGVYQMRVGKEAVGRQIGQNAAAGQCNNATGIGSHQIHVVLDQHDTLHARKFRGSNQGFHDGMFIGGGNARGRFIEQNNLRIEREGRGDIKQLLFALRKRSGDRVEPVAQSKYFGNLTDARR